MAHGASKLLVRVLLCQAALTGHHQECRWLLSGGAISLCLSLFLRHALPFARATHKREDDGQTHKGEEAVHKDIELVQVLDTHQMSNLYSTEGRFNARCLQPDTGQIWHEFILQPK